MGSVLLEKVMKTKTKYILSLVVKLAVFAVVVVGLADSFCGNSFAGPGKTLLYYTNQSNVLIAAICLAFALWQIFGKKSLPNWCYVVKYAGTVAITITFLVFWLFLAPFMKGNPHLFALNSICLHLVSPLLAIADFVLFDCNWLSGKKTVWWTLVFPCYYFAFAIICSCCGVTFDQNGAVMPYFFLDFYTYGWFTVDFQTPQLGVAYWLVAILGFVLGVGWLYLKVKRWRNKQDMM